MNNFEFVSPTKIIFGKGEESRIGEILKKEGYQKILFHYGKSSIFKIGLYDKVIKSLQNNNISYVELGGVEPNPKIDLVRKGVEIAKREKIELILAVGGGSVIDSSKAIACGALTNDDPWCFNAHEKLPEKSLPVGVILTISAAGSELSNSCVITNSTINVKNGFNSDLIRPKFVIMDPTLTFSVSPFQTACGIVDIMMHTLERYFSDVEDLIFTDEIALGLIKSVIIAGKRVMRNPHDYNARASLMIASSFSHNGLTGLGSKMYFTVHKLEHIISGTYDRVTHGAGLSILFLAWAKYTKEMFIDKWKKLGHNVFQINSKNIVDQTIDTLEKFFSELKMPIRFSEEKILSDDFEKLANIATSNKTKTILGVKELNYDDIIKIFTLAK